MSTDVKALSLSKRVFFTIFMIFTPHAQRERGKVIGRGVHICIRYTISKCGLCAHITLEFSVIPEAKPRDNRKRESYNERKTHTLI